MMMMTITIQCAQVLQSLYRCSAQSYSAERRELVIGVGHRLGLLQLRGPFANPPGWHAYAL